MATLRASAAYVASKIVAAVPATVRRDRPATNAQQEQDTTTASNQHPQWNDSEISAIRLTLNMGPDEAEALTPRLRRVKRKV